MITCGNYKTMHVVGAAAAAEDIVLAYANHYNEIDGQQDITVRCAVEYPLGSTPLPIFFGGKRDVVISPGADVTSDPVGIDVPAGAAVYVRTRVVVASGEKWPNLLTTYAPNGEGGVTGTTTTDLTTSGTVTTTNVLAYSPLAVLAVNRSLGDAGSPLVAIIGDSIASGQGETGTGNSDKGFIIRALEAANIPSVQIAKANETAQTFAGATGAPRRKRYLAGCSHAIVEYAINDVTANRTLAQIKADLVTIWTQLSQRGVQKIFQTTITPHTTSSDSFVTTANQTVGNATQEGIRTGLNDWIRSFPSPLMTGFFEIADIAETSRNSGIWKVQAGPAAYTLDGTHPVTAMHILMAAGIDTSKLV